MPQAKIFMFFMDKEQSRQMVAGNAASACKKCLQLAYRAVGRQKKARCDGKTRERERERERERDRQRQRERDRERENSPIKYLAIMVRAFTVVSLVISFFNRSRNKGKHSDISATKESPRLVII